LGEECAVGRDSLALLMAAPCLLLFLQIKNPTMGGPLHQEGLAGAVRARYAARA
jgi:hypothetical protein